MIPGEAGSGSVPETIVGVDVVEVAVVGDGVVLSAWAIPAGSVRTANKRTTADFDFAGLNISFSPDVRRLRWGESRNFRPQNRWIWIES